MAVCWLLGVCCWVCVVGCCCSLLVVGGFRLLRRLLFDVCCYKVLVRVRCVL